MFAYFIWWKTSTNIKFKTRIILLYTSKFMYLIFWFFSFFSFLRGNDETTSLFLSLSLSASSTAWRGELHPQSRSKSIHIEKGWWIQDRDTTSTMMMMIAMIAVRRTREGERERKKNKTPLKRRDPPRGVQGESSQTIFSMSPRKNKRTSRRPQRASARARESRTRAFQVCVAGCGCVFVNPWRRVRETSSSNNRAWLFRFIYEHI